MTQFNHVLGYEVLETLGHGARSVIMRVRDRRGDVYALKHVTRSSAADDRYVDQVIAEYRVSSRLKHKALRRSFKLIKDRSLSGTLRGVLLVMELVEGRTLDQFADANLVDLIKIYRRAARGLAAMHAAGYVHADIKPTNVIISEDNRVKLIDFGQSCPVGTVKQRIQGTPDYIAPEQRHRKPIIPQTDVFNLGATMYRVLTGRYVPTGMRKGEAGMRLEQDEPVVPPAEIDPRVPPALSSVVMDSIERRRSARPATMTEVVDRLDVALKQLQHRPDPA